MPPFHRLATRRLVQCANADNRPAAERHLSPGHRWVAQQVGGQSVPVLITPTATLRNSDEILRYIDAIAPPELKLYPTHPEPRQHVETLVQTFDSTLGSAVRLWVYFYLMDLPRLLQPLWCEGVPWFERLLFPIVFPWMRSNVLELYGINEATAIAASDLICKTFEQVDQLLADGRTYSRRHV